MPAAPLPRRHAVVIFESAREAELVVVADGIADVLDGEVREAEQIGRADHAVLHEKLLGRLADGVPEDLPEIAPVEARVGSDILHGDIILEVSLDIGDGLVYVEVAQLVASCVGGGGQGADQAVHKEIEMSDQVILGFVLVADNVEHLVSHCFPEGSEPGVIDRVVLCEAGDGERFFCPHAVKFQPHIGPGKAVVRHICGDTAGRDQKSLPGPDIVGASVVRHHFSASGKDIVEEVMIAGGRAEGMPGFTGLQSELEEIHVHEGTALKYRK